MFRHARNVEDNVRIEMKRHFIWVAHLIRSPWIEYPNIFWMEVRRAPYCHPPLRCDALSAASVDIP